MSLHTISFSDKPLEIPFVPAIRCEGEFTQLYLPSCSAYPFHHSTDRDVLLPDSIEEQFHLTIRTIESILAWKGADLSHVVRCVVYLTNIADKPIFDQLYEKTFSGHTPTRTCIIVSELLRPQLKLLVEATAAIDPITNKQENEEDMPYPSMITISNRENVHYLSGCTALPTNLAIEGHGCITPPHDIREQTRLTLHHLEFVLTKSGATKHDVVQCTIYLTDKTEMDAVNTEFEQFFGEHHPVRSLVVVKELALPGLRVEIDAIATSSLT